MAWYALYKWFKGFRKKSYINYILWYKKKLYDQWFHSLPVKEQEKILHKKKWREKQALLGLEAVLSSYSRAMTSGY